MLNITGTDLHKTGRRVTYVVTKRQFLQYDARARVLTAFRSAVQHSNAQCTSSSPDAFDSEYGEFESQSFPAAHDR